jgi:hypothetical protein
MQSIVRLAALPLLHYRYWTTAAVNRTAAALLLNVLVNY